MSWKGAKNRPRVKITGMQLTLTATASRPVSGPSSSPPGTRQKVDRLISSAIRAGLMPSTSSSSSGHTRRRQSPPRPVGSTLQPLSGSPAIRRSRSPTAPAALRSPRKYATRTALAREVPRGHTPSFARAACPLA